MINAFAAELHEEYMGEVFVKGHTMKLVIILPTQFGPIVMVLRKEGKRGRSSAS
jgi:hypothetical protein